MYRKHRADMSSPDNTVVLVTGASGYLATHVVQQLQAAGYRVRGTVRSLGNEERLAPLRKLCPGAKYPLELVEADLTKPETWDKAVEGCTYVIHTASPFPSSNADLDPENEIIKPAVEGSTRVLKAAVKAGVKRAVLTSSVVAVSGSNNVPDDRPATEDDWSDPDKMSPYSKSKVLAERAAWEVVAQQPDGSAKMELAVINPAFIMGPPFPGTAASSTSVNTIAKLMNGEVKEIPSAQFSVVDVRDVAAAHVKAMTVPGAAGFRHICNAKRMWYLDVAQTIADKFNKMGYEIPTIGKKEGGDNLTLDNSRLRNVLGVEPRAPEVTLVDMAHALVQQGSVNKTPQYKNK